MRAAQAAGSQGAEALQAWPVGLCRGPFRPKLPSASFCQGDSCCPAGGDRNGEKQGLWRVERGAGPGWRSQQLTWAAVLGVGIAHQQLAVSCVQRLLIRIFDSGTEQQH